MQYTGNSSFCISTSPLSSWCRMLFKNLLRTRISAQDSFASTFQEYTMSYFSFSNASIANLEFCKEFKVVTSSSKAQLCQYQYNQKKNWKKNIRSRCQIFRKITPLLCQHLERVATSAYHPRPPVGSRRDFDGPAKFSAIVRWEIPSSTSIIFQLLIYFNITATSRNSSGT